METDNYLLDRIRNILISKSVVWSEKRMFGGSCFMVADKMCFGTYKGGLMVRIEPTETDQLLLRSNVEQMIHGSKPMTGYLFVDPKGYDKDSDLEFWVQKCLNFNPKAKTSKSK